MSVNHHRNFLVLILLLLITAPFIMGQSYPPPTQPPPPTAYPGPASETPNLPTTEIPTLTPPAYQAPSPGQTETNPIVPTLANDIYLTENAEMGQSQATPVPSDTPTVSPTVTTTVSPTNPLLLTTETPSFIMNWGAFVLGFLVIIILGCGVGWWFLYRPRLPAK
jgi:hypothetical protein